jgi:hypothetical protein
LASRIVNFKSICFTQFLLDICYDTHFGFHVSLDRESKSVTFFWTTRFFFCIDKVFDFIYALKRVVQLKSVLGTKLSGKLSFRFTTYM